MTTLCQVLRQTPVKTHFGDKNRDGFLSTHNWISPKRDSKSLYRDISYKYVNYREAMTKLQAEQYDDLMTTQLRLEEEMTRRGQERYLRDVAKAKQAKREDGTAYGQTILAHRLEIVSVLWNVLVKDVLS